MSFELGQDRDRHVLRVRVGPRLDHAAGSRPTARTSCRSRRRERAAPGCPVGSTYTSSSIWRMPSDSNCTFERVVAVLPLLDRGRTAPPSARRGSCCASRAPGSGSAAGRVVEERDRRSAVAGPGARRRDQLVARPGRAAVPGSVNVSGSVAGRDRRAFGVIEPHRRRERPAVRRLRRGHRRRRGRRRRPAGRP